MQRPGIFPGRGPADQQPAPGDAPPVAHPPASGAEVVTGTSTAASPAEKPQESIPLLPPSLSDKPAQPATITLDKGVLAIRADNSSLSAILKHVASSSGMKLDGFQQDQRVFGIYGPGNPTEILSSLLQDAGYNFLMVGETEQGTPKEIVLTARSGAGASGGSAATTSSDDEPEETDSDSSNNNGPEQPPMPEQEPTPIPGASTAPPNSNGQHVKTPAEIIQELQRLRQQQSNPQ